MQNAGGEMILPSGGPPMLQYQHGRQDVSTGAIVA